jgi:protease-3
VTPERFNAFVETVLETALVRVYLFGNYDAVFAQSLAATLRSALPAQRSAATAYARERVYSPVPGQTLVKNTDLPVEDLGMMLLYAAPEASVANEAIGRVLARHLRNRAFDTLRTEEQLGYAAGGMTTTLQDHPMVGFYIQTPVKTPVEMLARFEAFAEEYAVMLDELTPEQFANLKSGVLTQLTEPPTNLSDEAGPFIGDWNRERYDFSSRMKMIAAVEAVSLVAMRDYYRDTVLSEAPSRILIQMRGERWQAEAFATIEGATLIESVEAFHEQMPVQPLN